MQQMENGNMNKIDTHSFGCRVNKYESQIMEKLTSEAGLENVILFNTCAVTQSAVREARRAIRKAKREQPHKKIIVSGCAAQIAPDEFANMQEVDLILGNEEKLHSKFYNFGIETSEKIKVNELHSVREACVHMIDGLDGCTRAFVQVQNGCNHRCTFCIIPYGRGVSRSVPQGAVIEQIKKLVGNGYKEIVLTGIDLTSWGADLPSAPNLGRLVHSILKHVPSLARLRLSSLDSIEIDEALFEALAYCPRLMPHLHLSLQSGDDMILKRMKRRHLSSHTIEFCQRLRKARPEIVFGADVIAGFPTETDEMFANSLSLVNRAGITHLHVFPFSARKGTPAARMPQVDNKIIKQRAEKLRAVGEKRLQNFLKSRIGKTEMVLMESNGVGRSEQFTPIKIANVKQGEMIRAKITGCNEKHLVGHVL